ncbi:hypothetical protein VOLCADRAFT_97883 [Volvox carteri f. nagariensis]|uniref:O-fucosyltransferase family protein n=1 Tax=Volvox carteri f. nagariensis TaxID=3068 RepID=D8UDW6_VOLCA|nr:uncharacterized protein VOLCADRAFT_97883 [Volvox carteri f. nagariensis]EFJ42163.1 hypothetical protein VOLCADRAFT_97883 [Volvox carteri f. nagariensis]|eukprot:XP_002956860.1 hypothetical protein VOLCADRAFT_97883 [Volvox carteri f. nagariensis]
MDPPRSSIAFPFLAFLALQDPGNAQGTRMHGGVDTSSLHDPTRSLRSKSINKSRHGGNTRPKPPQTGPFLIPLLPYGLSNQIVALKEALALAVVLNYTVVTLGFWPHRSEVAAAAGQHLEPGALTHRAVLELDAEEGEERNVEKSAEKQLQRINASEVIPFDMVFDRSSLASLVRVITWEEAIRQYGWSQSKGADALILLSRASGLDLVLEKVAAAGFMYTEHIHTARQYDFSCDSRGLSWLVRTYTTQVSLRLKKSAWITQIARNFVQEALAGWALRQQQQGEGEGEGEERKVETAVAMSAGFGPSAGATIPHYIAVHVRPYPDECLDYFVNMTQYDPGAASQVCSNPKLLIKIVSLVRKLVETRDAAAAVAGGTSGSPEQEPSGGGTMEWSPPPATIAPVPVPAAVFVMTHPRLRRVVEAEMSRLWESVKFSSEAILNSTDDPAHAAAVAAFSSNSTSSSPPSSPLPYLFFLGLSDLPPELRNHVASTSLLSMVEQQVCRQAEDFIGSKASSISVLVAQERVEGERLEAGGASPGGAAAVDGAGAQGGEEGAPGAASQDGDEREVQDAAVAMSDSAGSGSGGYGNDGRLSRITVLV